MVSIEDLNSSDYRQKVECIWRIAQRMGPYHTKSSYNSCVLSLASVTSTFLDFYFSSFLTIVCCCDWVLSRLLRNQLEKKESEWNNLRKQLQSDKSETKDFCCICAQRRSEWEKNTCNHRWWSSLRWENCSKHNQDYRQAVKVK